MTVSEASYTRRKAAILIGLRESMDEGAADAALALWVSDYAPTRPLTIIDFVADLERTQGLPARETAAVRMALYQALIKHDATRARPAPPVEAAAASPAIPSESAAFIVFRALAEAMRRGVEDSGPAAGREFAIALKRAGKLGASDLSRDALLSLRDSDESRLADALHAIYVAIAETLGPVQADRLLSRAVSAAQALPEAKQFSPSRLL